MVADEAKSDIETRTLMSATFVPSIAGPALLESQLHLAGEAGASQLTTIAIPKNIGDVLRTLLPAAADSGSRFIWISNFEAERFWAHPGSMRLPSVSQAADVAIVNRLEEMTLFLAEAPDLVILRHRSDAAFVDYLASLGLKTPRILTSEAADSTIPIAETILQNADLCIELQKLAQGNHGIYLLPYATTHLEEEIASVTGIPCVGAGAAVCQKVNSKIYSRRMSRELGLKTVPGGECESLEAIEAVYQDLSRNNNSALVIKESMGVSGRGLSLIDAPAKMQRLIALLKRRHKADSRVEFVCECWIDKAKDINYQIFVSPSGNVHLLNIKEAITNNGVHMGHHWPPVLLPEQHDCYQEAATAIGAQLYADGFTGIAGIDSIIDRTGVVYPVLEINARFNMSTYELRLDEVIAPQMEKIVKYYPLILSEPLRFDKLSSALGKDLFRSGSGAGVGVFCFATANCNFRSGATLPVKGRIYVFIAGLDAAEIERLDGAMRKALNTCGAITTHQRQEMVEA